MYTKMDTDNNGTVSHAELEAALRTHGVQAELRAILESLLPAAAADQAAGAAAFAGQGGVTREAFGAAFEDSARTQETTQNTHTNTQRHATSVTAASTTLMCLQCHEEYAYSCSGAEFSLNLLHTDCQNLSGHVTTACGW